METLRRLEFTKWMRDTRSLKGLTVSDISNKMGCTTQYISAIECGQRAVSFRKVIGIARALQGDEKEAIQAFFKDTLARERISAQVSIK
jgi:transcriptional regulator with XRE-family HTH domain